MKYFDRSHYRVIIATDHAGDVEYMVIPLPSWPEMDEFYDMVPADGAIWDPYAGQPGPMWFDSGLSWSAADFSNPDIYAHVEELIVTF